MIPRLGLSAVTLLGNSLFLGSQCAPQENLPMAPSESGPCLPDTPQMAYIKVLSRWAVGIWNMSWRLSRCAFRECLYMCEHSSVWATWADRVPDCVWRSLVLSAATPRAASAHRWQVGLPV